MNTILDRDTDVLFLYIYLSFTEIQNNESHTHLIFEYKSFSKYTEKSGLFSRYSIDLKSPQ